MNKELEINSTLSHYRIVRKIGEGGMGEVYLADDTKLNRKVALKILPAEFAEDKDRMSRFVREAQSASALNHPNIITIYEINEIDDLHFIATEYIKGKTLNEYAKTESLEFGSILDVAIQVASALAEAHSAGIVHRDIKPDNIMVRENGLAKILDFGIAKLTATPTADGEAATAVQSRTQAGMIIGTPQFMSPEQARGKDVDHQTDIFSFGVVLYEMLSGASPFTGETISDVIAAVLTKEPQRLRDVPPELAEIVQKTLQKDKRNRYQTANDLLRDLKEVKEELEFQDKLERTSPPNRTEVKTQILKAQTTAEDNPQSTIQNLKSIVVLPFSNIGADAADDYFSDGLTEEIISDLSKIRVLRVISRNSAMKLKGTAKDTKTIAGELNVRYVLDGSVRKAGQNLRISVQLIDGATDANLWAEKYSGFLDDIFEIQESVSRSIAEALKITLTSGEIEQILERPIADAQAYDLYLRARANFQQGVPEKLDRSIELLKQGLEIIGENELLYAALGYTYYFYFRWISKLDENYLRLANECLEKTFALNPVSSHGFSLKGMLSYSAGNIAEAVRSLEKAVRLQPTNTEALIWLAIYGEYIEGYYEASLKCVDEARLLDPLMPLNTVIKGFVYIFNGEFKEPLLWIERGLAIDASAPLIIWAATIAKAWCGKIDEAIAHADRLAELAPGWVYTEHALFLKHALRGEKEIALEHYTPDFDKEAAYDCHFALHIAHCFALIGEKEKALDFLEIAVRTGMVNYPFLSRFDPLLENIRREPRFLSLMTEAKQLSNEINNSTSGSDFRGESENLEEPQTQILQAPTTAEKSPTSNTDSENGFWVAVLPFKYRGVNSDLEDLAEGLSEEIITGLSRFSYLRVIARGSTLNYTGDSGEVRTIGKELGARYVLEGNLRQAGNKLRLAVRLVDAASGGNLWAENFEREFSPGAVFELQDDLVPRIVSTCADHFGVLVRSISDAVRGQNPQQLSPYEALMRGFGYHYLLNPQDHAEARDVLEKAVEESPNNADCWAMLSWVYSHEYGHGFNPRPGSLDRAIAAARRAVELAPSNHLAYQTLAVALFFRKEKAACLSAAERALSLNPLDASNEAIFLITFADDWERGCALIRRAMELNPYCPGWYWLMLGLNEYRKTNYREAAAEAVKANATGGWADVIFAAIYGQLGEHAAARDAVQNLIAAKMDSLEAVRELGAKWFDSQLVEHLLEGIGKAGLKTVSTQNSEESITQILKAQTTVEEKPTEVGTQNSIAVLPFTNMSADGDNEYFCDGLAEELLNALAKIDDLKVAARTSAFSFKGKNANVSEIGEKLSVKNVLEGSVRKSGNKLRISVQLVNAADGYQLWSEKYDRELKDIFDVQDKIALAVVDALKVKLFGDEKAAILKRYTNNPEAYQLYLKGRFYFSKFTVEGFGKSVEYYEQALAIEPGYAPAFAALSTSYICFWYLGFGETAEYVSKAQAAVKRALILDQSLAEAHFALALIKFNYERNWTESEKAFLKTIELNPSYEENYEHYAMFLAVMGRSDEAVVAAKRAVELAPLALKTIYIAGWAFWLAEQTGLAQEQGEKLLEMEPNFSGGHTHLGISLWNKGSYQKSLNALETAVKLGGGNDIKMLLGLLYGIVGERDKANQLLAEFERLDEQGIFTASQQAFICAGLGEMDRAFDLLEQASERREGVLVFLKQFSSLYPKFHNDSRMTNLLNRLGLPTDKSNQTDESLEAKTATLSSSELKTELPADAETQSADNEPTAERATNAKSETRNPKSKWWLFGLLGLFVLVGGFFGYKYLSSTKQIESIAVMPFVNESGNADVEYLSDGMTETLIKSLSNLPNLNVKPRSSVFRYKGKDTDLQTIARELNVQAILNGRVVQRGEQLTLSLELVDVQKDSVIWTESYNRKQSDLISLQSEIAKDVSTNLKTKLSGTEETKVTKTGTAIPEAYQAYLKGRYYWNRRTAENLKKAIEQFKAATDRDPNYALAFVGLADSYALLSDYGGTPTAEVLPQAKTYAERALSLDGQLAEAHATLGLINHASWQWAEADKEFKRAIEIDPNYATAYHWYSILLKALGRYDEALGMIKRAYEIDPLSSVIGVNVSETYQFLNKHDASVEISLKIIELDPNFGAAYDDLGLSYLKLERKAEALTAMEKAVELTNRASVLLGNLGYVYAVSGKRTEANAVIKELEANYARKEAVGQDVADVYAGLGEKDKAFEWLEKDFQARNGRLAEVRWQIAFEPLRDDPRFKDLLRRMNLPE